MGRAPGSYPGTCRFEACRGHLSEGLPRARYPVSKTGGSHGLGGSTPSPSASRHRPEPEVPRGGMAELERQRVASAQAAPPLAGSSPAASAFALRRRSNGRTPGCYPVDAGSSPAVAACPQTRIPRREDPLLALGRVWGCGPAVSRVRRVRSPSRAPTRRRSVDEHHAPTVAHGGSNPPGETASQG